MKAIQMVVLTIILLFVFNTSTQSQEKPNIIFIMADDLGYGDLGCYGQEQTKHYHLYWEF